MIENSLLAAVPRKTHQRLLGALESVELAFGEVLYEPGDTIRHVYFPGNSLVSLLTLADGHLALEVGLIGREGMVGIPLVLGHTESPVRALVQGAGAAMRMAAPPPGASSTTIRPSHVATRPRTIDSPSPRPGA